MVRWLKEHAAVLSLLGMAAAGAITAAQVGQAQAQSAAHEARQDGRLETIERRQDRDGARIERMDRNTAVICAVLAQQLRAGGLECERPPAKPE